MGARQEERRILGVHQGTEASIFEFLFFTLVYLNQPFANLFPLETFLKHKSSFFLDKNDRIVTRVVLQ